MEKMENFIRWGIVEDETSSRAIKFVIERFEWLFEIPDKTTLWDFENDKISSELKALFVEHLMPFSEDAIMNNAFDENFVILDEENKKSYYIKDRKSVFLRIEESVYLLDYEPILSIHKCIEDFILLQRGQEYRSIDESLKLLGADITHYKEAIDQAKMNSKRMEEMVLDICTDDMKMTRNQSLKTLALILACLMEHDIETETHQDSYSYIR